MTDEKEKSQEALQEGEERVGEKREQQERLTPKEAEAKFQALKEQYTGDAKDQLATFEGRLSEIQKMFQEADEEQLASYGGKKFQQLQRKAEEALSAFMKDVQKFETGAGGESKEDAKNAEIATEGERQWHPEFVKAKEAALAGIDARLKAIDATNLDEEAKKLAYEWWQMDGSKDQSKEYQDHQYKEALKQKTEWYAAEKDILERKRQGILTEHITEGEKQKAAYRASKQDQREGRQRSDTERWGDAARDIELARTETMRRYGTLPSEASIRKTAELAQMTEEQPPEAGEASKPEAEEESDVVTPPPAERPKGPQPPDRGVKEKAPPIGGEIKRAPEIRYNPRTSEIIRLTKLNTESFEREAEGASSWLKKIQQDIQDVYKQQDAYRVEKIVAPRILDTQLAMLRTTLKEARAQEEAVIIAGAFRGVAQERSDFLKKSAEDELTLTMEIDQLKGEFKKYHRKESTREGAQRRKKILEKRQDDLQKLLDERKSRLKEFTDKRINIERDNGLPVTETEKGESPPPASTVIDLASRRSPAGEEQQKKVAA